jgi:hypothetical protein
MKSAIRGKPWYSNGGWLAAISSTKMKSMCRIFRNRPDPSPVDKTAYLETVMAASNPNPRLLWIIP